MSAERPDRLPPSQDDAADLERYLRPPSGAVVLPLSILRRADAETRRTLVDVIVRARASVARE